jgi:hypothetical protein
MSGYGYGEDEPIVHCPYCNTPTNADYVDVGIGFVQCGPFHCTRCLASEIGPADKPRVLTAQEEDTGWYAPGAEPGSSANVIGGAVVSAVAMRKVYRDEFINNPLHSVPGYVDDWREQLRAQGLKDSV